MIIIRGASLLDKDLLVHLEKCAFGPKAWPNGSIGDSLSQPNVSVLIAKLQPILAKQTIYEEPQECGFLVWRRIVDEAEVLSLGVTQPYRKKGVAHALLIEFEKTALHKNLSKALLEVDANNIPALALYRANGYHEVGRRHHYYRNGEDALTMVKTINNKSH